MKKVHLIGNAHLDPVWLWQWQEGFAEIKATFRSALDRMKEFDDFKFTSACGAYYMWIEQSDPAMFREIQARVAEGRWCLVGGWLIQPDCNIPGGESFARHALITQRYFREKFGKMAKTGYNVDSFGHNGSLPMILRQSRMENYVFMRPMKNEKELPAHLFLWESADGSRVTTYRIPLHYNIDDKRRSFDEFWQIAEIDEPSDMMAFYGVGNHGGGPTVELLKRMHEQLPSNFVYSDPDAYFATQNTGSLPVLRDDLQYHAKGCYSACARIKRDNRYAEKGLLTAERLSVLAEHLMGVPYPAVELDHAWRRVLFNQFHDILGGCSIREAYDDAAKSHGEAMAIADRVINFACQQIAWNVNTLAGHTGSYVSDADAERIGVPVVVFNPLSFPVTVPVHVRKKYAHVREDGGAVVPSQTVRDSKTNHTDKYATLFTASLPAFGYKVYRLHRELTESEMECKLTVTDRSMENTHLRVEFSADGEICSLYDKRAGRELLAAPTALKLYDDTKHDTWAHGEVFLKDPVPCEITGSVHMTECGPVRASFRAEQKFGNSRIVRDYRLCADSDTLEVQVKVDFHEKFRLLKLEFPLSGEGHRAVCGIPYGSIERPTDGSEQVCGDWIALHGSAGGVGVASDSKHSFEAEGNVLSLTVLRSAMYADHYGQNERDEFCEFLDQGEQRFAYSVFPFAGAAHAESRAQILQTSPVVIPETFHGGKLPTSYEGMHVSTDHLTVTAVKKQADGEGVILRCFESEGENSAANIRLFHTVCDVFVPHNAVRTLLLKDGTVSETDFIE